MTLDEFKAQVSKLPKEKQMRVVDHLYQLVYDSMDSKVFRLMATSIKYAKGAKVDGHEDFQIAGKDLENLSHIQDKNRLIQKK